MATRGTEDDETDDDDENDDMMTETTKAKNDDEWRRVVATNVGNLFSLFSPECTAGCFKHVRSQILQQ